MSYRYRVEICTPMITSVLVIADRESEAHSRALNGEGKPSEHWTEESEVNAIKRLED